MIIEILQIVPEIPEIPAVDGKAAAKIYVWIISILVLLIVGLVTLYEKKLQKVTSRLDSVIDDSIERMERSNDVEKTGMARVNEIIVQLKEIVVLANRR